MKAASSGVSTGKENEDGVGKGNVTLTDSVKRELNNDEPSTDSASNNAAAPAKKRKPNTSEQQAWKHVGRLEFYLEIPRVKNPTALIEDLQSHSGKVLKVSPHDDSYNPSAIRVGIPGRRLTTIWKYGGDVFLSKFLMYSRKTKCTASFPSKKIEVVDDPKRKTFCLVPIDIHFYLHEEIDLFNHPDKNVKRQVKQLINYMRGGTQPNPAKYTWPIVREDRAVECARNAYVIENLMKKKTAKEWWK